MNEQIKTYSFYYNEPDSLAQNIGNHINNRDKLYNDINNLIESTAIEIRNDSLRENEKVITAQTSERIVPYLNGIPYEMNVIRYRKINDAILNVRFTDEAKWILFNKEVYKYNGKGIPYYFTKENLKEIAVGLSDLRKNLENDLTINSSVQHLLEETISWENRLTSFSDEAKASALELAELIQNDNILNKTDDFNFDNYRVVIANMIKNPIEDRTKESLSEYFKRLSETAEDDRVKNLAQQVEIEVRKI